MSRYIALRITRDSRDKGIGWALAEYKCCLIGQKLITNSAMKEAREYGGGADPFTLPHKLNDLLTGRYYRSWDDSKALIPALHEAETKLMGPTATLSKLLDMHFHRILPFTRLWRSFQRQWKN